ncbi:hypothetical protein WJX84_011001 [Apatococcus fuscideae]|uniref:Uncharacterized protein n=1 Tax=Apatococcus fuscideae TaxID=2026836 RepID=A0AAW1SWS8_9CHLO
MAAHEAPNTKPMLTVTHVDSRPHLMATQRMADKITSKWQETQDFSCDGDSEWIFGDRQREELLTQTTMGISKGWKESLLKELKTALETHAADVHDVHYSHDILAHGLLEMRKAVAKLPEESSPARMAGSPSRPSGADAEYDSNVATTWTLLAESELTIAHGYLFVAQDAANNAQQLANDTAGQATQVAKAISEMETLSDLVSVLRQKASRTLDRGKAAKLQSQADEQQLRLESWKVTHTANIERMSGLQAASVEANRDAAAAKTAVEVWKQHVATLAAKKLSSKQLAREYRAAVRAIKAQCASMESRGQLVLKHVLKVAKKQELEMSKGRLLVKFLARRMLNACVYDMELPVVISLYLPALQEQLLSAQSAGLLSTKQVKKPGTRLMESMNEDHSGAANMEKLYMDADPAVKLGTATARCLHRLLSAVPRDQEQEPEASQDDLKTAVEQLDWVLFSDGHRCKHGKLVLIQALPVAVRWQNKGVSILA